MREMDNRRSTNAGMTHWDLLGAARIMAARDGRAYPSLTMAERDQYSARATAALDLVTELRETYDVMLDAIGAERADSALATLVSPLVADAFALDFAQRKAHGPVDIVQGPAAV